MLNEHATGPRLHYTSGTPTHPMSPLVKLCWFRDEHPDILRLTDRWIGLKDWVLVNFTGQVVTELVLHVRDARHGDWRLELRPSN